MPHLGRVAAFWPGAHAAWRGEWRGLALACGFAGLLNGQLLASFVWTDVLTGRAALAGWGAVVAAWLLMLVWQRRLSHGGNDSRHPADGDLFPAAMVQYLQGNWVAAEQALGRLLRSNPRDAEARLLLATLWRHTGRPAEARAALEHLRRQESGVKWEAEIGRELELLSRAAARSVVAAQEPPPEAAAPGRAA